MSTDPQDHPSSDASRRRAFCRACIGGMTVLSAGAVGFPVVTFLGYPIRLSTERPLEVPVDSLAPGQAYYAEVAGRQVIVLARDEGPEVFNAACTHLGCNVLWDTAEGIFRCPCHGAMFDDAGNVISGPVNVPLRKIPFEIKDGKIVVA